MFSFQRQSCDFFVETSSSKNLELITDIQARESTRGLRKNKLFPS